MLMRAFRVVRPRSFETVQVPRPHLSSGNADRLLIQTRWVSICGSDIPFFTGNERFKTWPLLPGAPIHECVGQVVKSTLKPAFTMYERHEQGAIKVVLDVACWDSN